MEQGKRLHDAQPALHVRLRRCRLAPGFFGSERDTGGSAPDASHPAVLAGAPPLLQRAASLLRAVRRSSMRYRSRPPADRADPPLGAAAAMEADSPGTAGSG